MDRRSNQFLEPERAGGKMLGWAVKQLVFWLFAGFIVYLVAVNSPLFRGAAPVSRSAPPSAEVTPAPASAVLSAQPEQLRPLGQAVPVVTNSLRLRTQPDGYAYVRARVNDAEMIMAFDTGASLVSLTLKDAIRAGVAGNLNYSLSFATANGHGRGAPVMLREIRIGQLVIPDVRAVVMENMQVSLLGQTFLSRLHSYQMQGGVLTLTWQ